MLTRGPVKFWLHLTNKTTFHVTALKRGSRYQLTFWVQALHQCCVKKKGLNKSSWIVCHVGSKCLIGSMFKKSASENMRVLISIRSVGRCWAVSLWRRPSSYLLPKSATFRKCKLVGLFSAKFLLHVSLSWTNQKCSSWNNLCLLLHLGCYWEGYFWFVRYAEHNGSLIGLRQHRIFLKFQYIYHESIRPLKPLTTGNGWNWITFNSVQHTLGT